MKKIKAKFEKLFYLVKKSFYFAWHRHHFLIPPKAMKKYIGSFFTVLKRTGTMSNLFVNQSAYLKWIEENEKPLKKENFKYNPLISVIIPTYNVSHELLCECLDSILSNSYTNFEVCIADDCSSNTETINTLKEYENKDKRIKVLFRKKNGHISEASNSAISIAKGEFILLVDNDDTISPYAMQEMVRVLNNDKTIDFIYSDEDKIDFKGKRCEPHFKPDWSPDTFMGLNYICHLTMIRTKLVKDVGCFRSSCNGSQDYDLFLRVTEKTNKIYHIEKILYHWRMSETSTAGYLGNKSYVKDATHLALNDALKRRNIKGTVSDNPRVSSYLINYEIIGNPKVSIIIPTKNHADITKRCIDSIYEKTLYKNFEIILIDNGSTEKESLELFEHYKNEHSNFKVLRLVCEFNYSYINNMGVKEATGDYILFLNNDTEVIDENYLGEMLSYAQLEHVGCVGIKLLYPDGLVQHAGVVIGYGGEAGHIYVTATKTDNGLMGRLAMPYNYSAVTAACLMIKKSKFLKVNGFDEKLKVALNDVDLNLKVLEKGYYNLLLPQITMKHYESKSRGYEDTKEKDDRFKSEKEYMRQKWGKTLEEDKFFSKNNF